MSAKADETKTLNEVLVALTKTNINQMQKIEDEIVATKKRLEELEGSQFELHNTISGLLNKLDRLPDFLGETR